MAILRLSPAWQWWRRAPRNRLPASLTVGPTRPLFIPDRKGTWCSTQQRAGGPTACLNRPVTCAPLPTLRRGDRIPACNKSRAISLSGFASHVVNKYYQPGAERARKVGQLFATIARRYDLINDLQSFGLHRVWKRRLVRLAAP